MKYRHFVIGCVASACAVLSCAASPPPTAHADVPAPTGERCPHGCSRGEVCIRAWKGAAHEEHCDALLDECASPEVAEARKALADTMHDYERARELFENHAATANDMELAEDEKKKAESDVARAEDESVPRCNERCRDAACNGAKCVAAKGVIECVVQ